MKKTPTSKSAARSRAIANGYRSGLEEQQMSILQRLGISAKTIFESIKVAYIKKPSTYTPDFPLPNGVIIETKGRFTAEDRSKHLLIQKQYPGLDIRFVFSNPHQKMAGQKDKEFREWLKFEKKILKASKVVKEKHRAEFFTTLTRPPSQTTYAMWCEKNGFQWAAVNIPTAWVIEPDCPHKLAAIDAAKPSRK